MVITPCDVRLCHITAATRYHITLSQPPRCVISQPPRCIAVSYHPSHAVAYHSRHAVSYQPLFLLNVKNIYSPTQSSGVHSNLSRDFCLCRPCNFAQALHDCLVSCKSLRCFNWKAHDLARHFNHLNPILWLGGMLLLVPAEQRMWQRVKLNIVH